MKQFHNVSLPQLLTAAAYLFRFAIADMLRMIVEGETYAVHLLIDGKHILYMEDGLPDFRLMDMSTLERK